MTEYVAVNDRGLRVGQSHHKAVLSDVEVEALVRDRGPKEFPAMSYTDLAKKYGISKSSVRDYLIGRRRGQGQTLKRRAPTNMVKPDKKVEVRLRVPTRARAILHRLGGGLFISSLMRLVDAEFRRCPGIHDEDAAERVLERIQRSVRAGGAHHASKALRTANDSADS